MYSLLGLGNEDWEVLKALLNKMGMALVPIQKKDKDRKTKGNGSSRKGMRELKNLRCDINYERERGASVTNRVETSN